MQFYRTANGFFSFEPVSVGRREKKKFSMTGPTSFLLWHGQKLKVVVSYVPSLTSYRFLIVRVELVKQSNFSRGTFLKRGTCRARAVPEIQVCNNRAAAARSEEGIITMDPPNITAGTTYRYV